MSQKSKSHENLNTNYTKIDQKSKDLLFELHYKFWQNDLHNIIQKIILI